MKKMRKIVNLCAGIFSLLCLLLLAAGIAERFIPSESEVHELLLYVTAGCGAETMYNSPLGTYMRRLDVWFEKFIVVYAGLLLLFLLVCTVRFFKMRNGNHLPKRKTEISSIIVGGVFFYLEYAYLKQEKWFKLHLSDLDYPVSLFYFIGTLFFFLLMATVLLLLFNFVLNLLSANAGNKYRVPDNAITNGNRAFDPSAGVATANRQTPVTPVSAAEEAPHSAQTIAAETLARQKFCAPVQPVVTEQQPQPSPSSAGTQPLSAPAAAQPAAAGIQAEDAADKAQPAAETVPAAKAPPEKKETTQKESILSTHVFNLKTCFFLPILLFGVEIVVVCLAKASGSHGAGIVLWLLALVNLAYAGWKMVQAVQSVKRHVVITTTRVYLQNYATGNTVISVPIADIKNVSTETTAASIRSDYGNLVLFLTGGQKIKFDFVLDIVQAKENILLAKRKAENNALSL